MPIKIKNKLRQLQNTAEKASKLTQEVEEMFEIYGLDTDCLKACGEFEVDTEALTFVTYAEGDVEDNIKEIEYVFLHYVNQDKIS